MPKIRALKIPPGKTAYNDRIHPPENNPENRAKQKYKHSLWRKKDTWNLPPRQDLLVRARLRKTAAAGLAGNDVGGEALN
jgi:hypothetical protein